MPAQAIPAPIGGLRTAENREPRRNCQLNKVHAMNAWRSSFRLFLPVKIHSKTILYSRESFVDETKTATARLSARLLSGALAEQLLYVVTLSKPDASGHGSKFDMTLLEVYYSMVYFTNIQ